MISPDTQTAAPARPEISPAFAELFVANVNAPFSYQLHQLFNAWWAHAPEQTIAKYANRLLSTPQGSTFVSDAWLADPVDLETLRDYPDASLGRAYHDFIVSNQLREKLAIDYRKFHDSLKASGLLDRMPAPLQYAVIRGFQIHDILHVLTGYAATPRDEIALQAFCLAQLNFPYFSMWIAHVSARMTYIDPDLIEGTMDAVTEGWRFGRAAANLQFQRWEDSFDEPLSKLRSAARIAAVGKAPLLA